jgi:hypothetical protein
VPVARSAAELVQLVMERCSVDRFDEHQQATKQIVALTPRTETVGAQISEFLRS